MFLPLCYQILPFIFGAAVSDGGYVPASVFPNVTVPFIFSAAVGDGGYVPAAVHGSAGCVAGHLQDRLARSLQRQRVPRQKVQ